MLIASDSITLKEYLYLNKKTVKEFGDYLGYSRAHMSLVVNEAIRPSRPLALSIERATNGQVKAEDLLKIGRHEFPQTVPTEKLIQDQKQDNQDGNPDQ